MSKYMMVLSRHEANLRRLLAKCELMLKTQKDDERFDKYVETLEDMLHEIKKQADCSHESLQQYRTRIVNLKTTLGITSSKYEDMYDPETMRQDLLGLRQRNVTKEKLATEDLNEVLKYHEDVQKKITDEMLTFTRSLKEQSEMANKIIRKDTEVVGNSMQLTDQNYAKLGVESAKLQEHSRRAWKCWMWIMLAVVMIVFINMVLFMKVMKKG